MRLAFMIEAENVQKNSDSKPGSLKNYKEFLRDRFEKKKLPLKEAREDLLWDLFTRVEKHEMRGRNVRPILVRFVRNIKKLNHKTNT